MKPIHEIFREAADLIKFAENQPNAPIKALNPLQLAQLNSLKAEIEKYFVKINVLYKKQFNVAASADDIVNVLSYLINKNEIDSINHAAKKLLDTDWLGIDQSAAAFSNMGTAIFYLHANKQDLASEKYRLQQQINLGRSNSMAAIWEALDMQDLMLAQPINEKLNKKIQEIDQSELIANIIKGTYVSVREENLKYLKDSFEKLNGKLPDKIKNYLHDDQTYSELLDNLKESLRVLTNNKEAKLSYGELEANCHDCDNNILQIVSQLNSGLNFYLDTVKNNLSRDEAERLEDQVVDVQSLSLSLAYLGPDMDANKVIIDKYLDHFVGTLNALSNDTEELQTNYKHNVDKALQHTNEKINSKDNPIILTANDLLDSENPWVKELFSKSTKEKVVFMAPKTDNLDQIISDTHREVTVNDKPFRYKDHDICRQKLIETFGEQIANLLIKHFSQLPSYLAAGPLQTGLSNVDDDVNPFVINTNPNGRSDNLYVKDNILYRDMKVSHFDVVFLNTGDKWQIKSNINVLAWLAEDGFRVEKIGLNNPLAARVMMTEFGKEELIERVKNIQADEKSFQEQKEDLKVSLLTANQDDVVEQHQALVDQALLNITQLKTGVISFEEYDNNKLNIQNQLNTLPKIGAPDVEIGSDDEFNFENTRPRNRS